MSIYLHYNVKGIQSFIFKIPKLKYIIGGSALIDRFDKEIVKNLEFSAAKYIFSGGGKGIFLCESEKDLEILKHEIIRKAHLFGLDIQFGQDADYSQAVQHTDELYSFIPEMHGGYPCPESGLYPVKPGENIHPVIQKRRSSRRFEEMFLSDVLIPGKIRDELDFFRNINGDEPEGVDGARALGNRNRWAVISMDGNDMGAQFRAQREQNRSATDMQLWIQKMSRTLDKNTIQAASAGIQRVVSEWAGFGGKEAVLEGGIVTLPIRPLFVGGDDIVMLCNTSYAITFVKEVIRVFEKLSEETAELWPATNGKLTISAGILYTSVTLPLHTAINYSESLLGIAKGWGRKLSKKGEAVPSCIDWEQITDSLVDTPAAKRQRELVFFDADIERTIKLTQRPYTIEKFTIIEKLAQQYGHGKETKLPRTIRYKILPALKKGYAERLAFAAEIKKNHPDFSQALNEFDITDSAWECNKDKTEQSINIIDALMLLEEDNRMEKEGL